MRLIDADAYATQMKKRQDACLRWKEDAVLDGDDETRLRADGALSTFIEAKLTLDKIPTIDVAPVVHAKMMRTDAYPHRIYCGNCYKTLIPNEEYCFEKNEFPKFCMWCGAKMEGEDESNS